MIILFTLLPLILIVISAVASGKLRLGALLLLLIYTLTALILLLRAEPVTLAGKIGLGAISCLLLYALVASTVEGFLIFEGRERRKRGFDELLGRYDR
jgi:hypothetical protein